MDQKLKKFEIEFQRKPSVRVLDRSGDRQPREAVGRCRFDCYSRIVQVVALAIHFQDPIDQGEIRNYADLARLGCIRGERIRRIVMLAWLTPHMER